MKHQPILVTFLSAAAFEVRCNKEEAAHLNKIKVGWPRWIRLATTGSDRKQVTVKNDSVNRASALSWD